MSRSRQVVRIHTIIVPDSNINHNNIRGCILIMNITNAPSTWEWTRYGITMDDEVYDRLEEKLPRAITIYELRDDSYIILATDRPQARDLEILQMYKCEEDGSKIS